MAKPKKKLKRSVKWVLSIVGIGVLAIVITLLLNQSSESKGFHLNSQPSLGEETAPVEIVEFGDYKCPSCKSFNESFFPVIQDELIATGKVKFYFVNYPFINVDSKRAAEFAEVVHKELGNNVFWQFHHVLYDKQPADPKAEKKDVFTENFLKETLAGLVSEEEMQQVVKAYENGAGENSVEVDLNYADEMNVTGTPTLFVDGKRFDGRDLSDLNKMVEKSMNE
ncbi:MAG: thioredoxin domain-containing protein [Anaerobacillus sp.]